MQNMIGFYNSEAERFAKAHVGMDKKARELLVDDFINNDRTQISWERGLKNALVKNIRFEFNQKSLTQCLYRPFTKQWSYFNRHFNAMVYQMPRIFPDSSVENRVICVTAKGSKAFSCVMSDVFPDLNSMEAGAQCFPLKLYEPINAETSGNSQACEDLFAVQPAPSTAPAGQYHVKDGISDAGLAHFTAAYPDTAISKEDVFYYIYSLLHSEDYKASYADNLSKELPRIPCVKTAADFWAFSKAGRALAELHINYETVQPYPVTFEGSGLSGLTASDYHVTQMKFGKNGKDKDKTTVIYNHKITMTTIPLAAYDYVVNGKPALEWVMERQAVTTHKDSGIVNDANLWASETMNNPAYPLELFLRVITVSLETMKIVKGLPKLDIK